MGKTYEQLPGNLEQPSARRRISERRLSVEALVVTYLTPYCLPSLVPTFWWLDLERARDESYSQACKGLFDVAAYVTVSENALPRFTPKRRKRRSGAPLEIPVIPCWKVRSYAGGLIP